MPLKRAASKSTSRTSKRAIATEEEASVVCPICVKPVLDSDGENGGHDGLFCEGKCQVWFHRWCAGVTRERYDAISPTDDPFLCPTCSMANCQAIIATQSADISSLRQSINSLAEEVRELKNTVASLQNQFQLAVSSNNISESAKTSDAARDTRSVKAKRKPKLPRSQEQPHLRPASAANNENVKSSVPVENARKIWGTMKTASPKTILTAIQHVVPNLTSLCVKRKFQASNGITKKWWHVVRGSKADIELLDSGWSKIEIQTGWKLQPLLSFATTISAIPVASLEASAVPSTVSAGTGTSDITQTAVSKAPVSTPSRSLEFPAPKSISLPPVSVPAASVPAPATPGPSSPSVLTPASVHASGSTETGSFCPSPELHCFQLKPR